MQKTFYISLDSARGASSLTVSEYETRCCFPRYEGTKSTGLAAFWKPRALRNAEGFSHLSSRPAPPPLIDTQILEKWATGHRNILSMSPSKCIVRVPRGTWYKCLNGYQLSPKDLPVLCSVRNSVLYLARGKAILPRKIPWLDALGNLQGAATARCKYPPPRNSPQQWTRQYCT